MPSIKIDKFFGIAPRYSARKLGDFQGQDAHNVALWSQELESIKSGLIAANPSKVGTIHSIYPLNDKWLHWTQDVDVAEAPISQEGLDERVYFTGHYQPKSTNATLGTVGGGTDYPLDEYKLGLPPPDSAPTVGITGGSSNYPETRSYVYTFVTEWGEEGPPSDPTEYIAAHDDATQWDISAMSVAPVDNGTITGVVVSSTYLTLTIDTAHHIEDGDYIVIPDTITGTGDLPDDMPGTWKATRVDIDEITIPVVTTGVYTSGGTWDREVKINITGMVKRIYRTSGGIFKYVDEVAVATTTLTDNIADSALGEELPSTEWVSPPSDLSGLMVHPSGFMVGFFGNVLAFSPAYIPHAYPESYQLTFPYEIVAIGLAGGTIVVATKGLPYFVFGSDPSAMSESKINIKQACVSKRSMVSVFNGVVYASPDGLVYIPAAGTPKIITEEWLTKKEWDLYSPSTIEAATHDDRYYGFYSSGGEDENEAGAIVFDPAEKEIALTTVGIAADATYTDIESDEMYLWDNGNIYQWNSGGSYLTFQWKSKTFIAKQPLNFVAARVMYTSGSGLTDAEKADALAAAVASVDALVVNPIVSVVGTDISFDNAGSSIDSTSTDLSVFSDGQSITVAGTSNNNKVFIINGTPTSNEIITTVAPTTESAGASVTISTITTKRYDGGFNGFPVNQYEVNGGPYTAATNEIVNAPSSGVIFKVYKDGVLWHEETITNSNPFRIPGGDEATRWEFELSGTDAIVHEMMVATTMSELANQ